MGNKEVTQKTGLEKLAECIDKMYDELFFGEIGDWNSKYYGVNMKEKRDKIRKERSNKDKTKMS